MRLSCAILIAFSLFSGVTLAGDSAPAEVAKQPRLLAQNKVKPGTEGAKPAPAAISNEEADEVLDFVREHHAELAELLENLKESRPKEFQKAVRDLLRVRDRLATMKKNNLPRYELELDVWKAESRIQLLAARLQMSDTKELREQLRAALNEQYDRRVTLLKFERDSIQERVKKVDAQLKRLDQERSQTIDRQLQVLVKPTQAKAPKTDKKPVAAPAKTKNPSVNSPGNKQKP